MHVFCVGHSRDFFGALKKPRVRPRGGHRWIPLTGKRGEARTRKIRHVSDVLFWRHRAKTERVAGVIGQQISGQLRGLQNPVDQGWQTSRVFCLTRQKLLPFPSWWTWLWSGIPPTSHLTLSTWQDRKPRSPVDNAKRGQIGQRSSCRTNNGNRRGCTGRHPERAKKSPPESGFRPCRAGSCNCRGPPFPM